MPIVSRQQIDNFAAMLPEEVKAAVADGTTAGVDKRAEVLAADYPDADALRRTAGQVRQHALDHLDDYLAQAEERMTARGIKVHYAWDVATARSLILDLIRADDTVGPLPQILLEPVLVIRDSTARPGEGRGSATEMHDYGVDSGREVVPARP